MQYCMHFTFMRSKTELDNGSVKWTKLVASDDVSINAYTCAGVILALSYYSIDLCKHLI